MLLVLFLDTLVCNINGVVIVVTCCYSIGFSPTNNNTNTVDFANTGRHVYFANNNTNTVYSTHNITNTVCFANKTHKQQHKHMAQSRSKRASPISADDNALS